MIFGSRQGEKERNAAMGASSWTSARHVLTVLARRSTPCFCLSWDFFFFFLHSHTVAHCRCSRGSWKRWSPWLKLSAGRPEPPGLGAASVAAGRRRLRLTGWTLSDGRVRCRFFSPWKCPPGRPTLSLWKWERETRERQQPAGLLNSNKVSLVVVFSMAVTPSGYIT